MIFVLDLRNYTSIIRFKEALGVDASLQLFLPIEWKNMNNIATELFLYILGRVL